MVICYSTLLISLCLDLFNGIVWSSFNLVYDVSVTPGFNNANGEWDEYPPYINSEGLEIGSPVRIWPLFHINIYIISTCTA